MYLNMNTGRFTTGRHIDVRPILASMLCLIATAAAQVPSLAWGGKGHEVVGAVARQSLSSSLDGARALQEVERLLPANETLITAPTWADRIRDGGFDAESRSFLAKNKNHKNWHFVNLPFNTTRPYQLGQAGTNKTDIVQMMRTCIQVLQASSDDHTGPNGNDGPNLSKRQALLLLVHYAGDIHQPLHVGCGYVVESNERFSFALPTGANGAVMDRGGNNLLFGPQNRTKLHSYWDTYVVNRATGSRSPETYAEDLIDNLPPQIAWKASGAVDTWPAQWANDSRVEAAKAYDGIKIRRELSEGKWAIERPDGYLSTAKGIVRVQLAKGGYRLAELLKTIWPNP